jgi:hypothetical protein
MGLIELDADDVVAAIQQWVPGPLFSEARCQDALFRFLKRRFPKKVLTMEERVGPGRADIVVRLKDWTGFGATVVIELKYGLTTANEYRRLVGQVADYIKEKMEVVVVLCGPTSSTLASRVKDHMRTLAADKVWFKGHVLTKPVAERTTGGHFLPGNAKDAGRSG